jgi:hypothetical protein
MFNKNNINENNKITNTNSDKNGNNARNENISCLQNKYVKNSRTSRV